MNDVLNKILERYELDKPILMRDKLDIIWDKKKVKDQGFSPDKKPELSPEEEFD